MHSLTTPISIAKAEHQIQYMEKLITNQQLVRTAIQKFKETPTFEPWAINPRNDEKYAILEEITETAENCICSVSLGDHWTGVR